jgi:hypothetical protein
VHVGDEAAVDLDDVEGQRAQVRKRREAGSEIVEREADALVLEAGNDRPG